METPLIKKSWKAGMNSLAIVYPNKYYGGVYCLAPLIIYNIVNKMPNWICERKFLDKNGLNGFDLVGFTIQYELDYKNVIEIINKYKPKITFAGGPCINANHKSFSKGIDFFVIGEVEEVLPKVLNLYKKNKSEFLKKVAKLNGVFVPSISKEVTIADVKDINKVEYPIIQPFPEKVDKKFVFGEVFILEIERGCPFRCKFCAMPHMHNRIKFRNIEAIKKIIDQGIKINKRNKVVIYSPSFSHPKRKEILKYLLDKKLRFSVPSLKIEFIDEELLKLIKLGGQKTLTIAPECNESLRKKIGKSVPDKMFFDFVESINKLNFETLKLYFMVGLPGQTENDLDEMIQFIKKMKDGFNGNLYLSINPFVPKPKTMFEKHRFNKKIIKKQISYLKKRLINVKYKVAGIRTSYLEWKIAKI